MRDTANRRARKGAALAAGLASWLLALSCGQILGSSDLEIGDCVDKALRCTGNTLERCAQGRWSLDDACGNKTCDPGTAKCVGECEPDSKRCTGNTPQTCGADGQWQNATTLCAVGQHCSGGLCMVDCVSNDLRCVGNTPQLCSVAGQWTDSPSGPCKGKTCLSGVCMGACALGDAKCEGATPQACDVNGDWKDQPVCASSCVSGSCPGPSCAGLAKNCGPAQDESCCLSPVVWGGTYNRSNQVAYPATVSDFRLDRFEVTVGRFRAFVNGFPGNRPTEGAGAHPLIPNSGWSSTWDAKLPMNKTNLRDALNSCSNATWADMADGIEQENLPINCIDWYTAFAFCAWDRARLPTEAEWNYAAAGGAEQRVFPWSNPPSAQTIDDSYALYFGHTLGSVGFTSAKGDGKWRQADLASSLAEWTLDYYKFSYDTPCKDCANLSPLLPERVLRGGSWYNAAQDLLTSTRNRGEPGQRQPVTGIRCARQL